MIFSIISAVCIVTITLLFVLNIGVISRKLDEQYSLIEELQEAISVIKKMKKEEM